MPPEIQDNIGLIAIGAAALYAFWRYNKSKGRTVAPVQAAQSPAPQTVYVPVPGEQPKFFDLFVADKREREAELERIALRGTLDKIAGILGPEKPADPKP